MNANKISIERSFKRQAVKAVLSIIGFIFVYALLVVLTIGLAIALGMLAILIVSWHAGFHTGILALGLVGTGLLVLFFLIKFLFKRYKQDMTGLKEVRESEQPELFRVIREVVGQTGVPFPKKVFLTADINAFVFYNSSFWSMFLPVRKNLAIGAGLLNSVTVTEFKAILAHEFGHFSQRSMKIGSFVYNVNRILYNLLYDNEGMSRIIQFWSGLHDYFQMFARLGIKIIQGIQWILQRVYAWINLNNSGLSREMEFHADQVAAHAYGSRALQRSLIRLEMASFAWNQLSLYYSKENFQGTCPERLYEQHQLMMQKTCTDFEIPTEKALPDIPLPMVQRFSQTKLVFENQWASHPALRDRIEAVADCPETTGPADDRKAIVLLSHLEELEREFALTWFTPRDNQQNPEFLASSEFMSRVQNMQQVKHPVFHGYYERKSPPLIPFEEALANQSPDMQAAPESMFSSALTARLQELGILIDDIATISAVKEGVYDIASFEYDGQRFTKSDLQPLLDQLMEKLEQGMKEIRERDEQILISVYKAAAQAGLSGECKALYEHYLKIHRQNAGYNDIYSRMCEVSYFMQETNTFDAIRAGMNSLKEYESTFRDMARTLSQDPDYSRYLDHDERQQLDTYLEQDWNYFFEPEYDEANVGKLYAGMHSVYNMLYRAEEEARESWLDFMSTLVSRAAAA